MTKQGIFKTEAEVIDEMRRLLGDRPHRALARELDLSEPLIQGVLKGRLPIGPKLASRLGYTIQTQKVFTKNGKS